MVDVWNGERVRCFAGEESSFAATSGFRGEPSDFSGDTRADDRNRFVVAGNFIAELLSKPREGEQWTVPGCVCKNVCSAALLGDDG